MLPCWNAAATIERSLASVLDDESLPLECVVVDDGSTDGTADVVQAVAERDPRVVLLRLPANAGVSNARNRGLEIVRGEWLSFLDADDRFLPGGVAALLAATDDPGVRAVIGQRIWADGERIWHSTLYDHVDIREPGRKSIVGAPGLLYSVAATGKLFHRSLTTDLRIRGPRPRRPAVDHPGLAACRRRDRGARDDGLRMDAAPPRPLRRHDHDGDPGIGGALRRVGGGGARGVPRGERRGRGGYRGPGDRLTVRQAYAERLVRSDFSGPVRSAIDRHDPATARLYDALGELLQVIPPVILARSDVVVRSTLRAPWFRWSELDPEARAAYWRMVEPVRRADPGVGSRIVGLPGSGVAFDETRRLDLTGHGALAAL